MPRNPQPLPQPIAFGTGLIALDVILDGQLGSAEAHLAAGGTCANVLAILAYLGWESHAVARLGADAPSRRVHRLLSEVGVSLEFGELEPTCETPIILQRNSVNAKGQPSHRFSSRCPTCGDWWPSYRPITLEAAGEVTMAVSFLENAGLPPRVFFFDRASPAALLLASEFARVGALVVFEPAGFTDERLFEAALRLSHIVKYADDRAARFRPLLEQIRRTGDGWLLEVETMGVRGLRFRAPHAGVADWRTVPACPAPHVRDAAGAGDWCTAVLLDGVARHGVEGLRRLRAGILEQQLVLAQAYAALSCGFLGARGMMEYRTHSAISAKVGELLIGSGPSAATDGTGHLEKRLVAHRTAVQFSFCGACG
jgi:sugar/nucleoside kinase (ribokinase family)